MFWTLAYPRLARLEPRCAPFTKIWNDEGSEYGIVLGVIIMLERVGPAILVVTFECGVAD